MELELGKEYAVQYKDEQKVRLLTFRGVDKGFHIFEDKGKLVPTRIHNITVRKIYNPNDTKGKNYGEEITGKSHSKKSGS